MHHSPCVRERCSNVPSTLCPERIATEIEGVQRPVEQMGTKVVMIQRTVTQSVLVGFRRNKNQCAHNSPRMRKRCSNVPSTLIPEWIFRENEGVQRPVENRIEQKLCHKMLVYWLFFFKLYIHSCNLCRVLSSSKVPV